MRNITFDNEGKNNLEKEAIEWIRIWCEDTNNKEKPRVALIGDSITENYYRMVKEALKDVAKVDYLATSYSIASDMYQGCVKSFFQDSVYEVVHFNYGLHAYSVNEEIYSSCCMGMLQFISSRAKTIVATTTTVLDETLEAHNLRWKEKVLVRNEKIKAIADKLDLNINDLYAVCETFDKTKRYVDGVHFTEEGYGLLAESVINSVRECL